MNATTLILVRHGATAANLGRPYILQGSRPDNDLAALGCSQARAAGNALAGLPIVALYTSPLRRARETARLISDRLGVPAVIEDGLREADFGDWSGLTWPEIESRWPAEHRAFHADCERNGYPGGENLAQVRQRTLPIVERLAAHHTGDTFVVVGHGTVNRVLLAAWLNLPLRYARHIPQDNGAFSVVDFFGDRAKVRTLNAMADLAPRLTRSSRPPARQSSGRPLPRAMGR